MAEKKIVENKLIRHIKSGNLLKFSLNYMREKMTTDMKYHITFLLGKNKLDGEYLHVYRCFKNQYSGTSSMFWNNISKKMEKEMVANGLHDFRRLKFSHYFFKKPTTDEFMNYYKYIKSIDRLSILSCIKESFIGNPRHVMTVNGKGLTADFLQSIEEFYDILNYTGWPLDKKTTICEIGGGYGRLAYIFLKTMPNIKYVFVDIPETLITAYYFIKENDLAERCDFLIPNEICKANPELWINIDSFQELTYEIIDTYFDAISRNGKFLFMKELETNHNIVDKTHLNIYKYPFRKNMKVAATKVSDKPKIRFDDYNNKWEPYVTMFIKIGGHDE